MCSGPSPLHWRCLECSAEMKACAHYNKVIKAVDGEDYVTQDMGIRLLADEEEHLVLFRGFLKEYQAN